MGFEPPDRVEREAAEEVLLQVRGAQTPVQICRTLPRTYYTEMSTCRCVDPSFNYPSSLGRL